jgi:uncharacterized cupin superfamily protein
LISEPLSWWSFSRTSWRPSGVIELTPEGGEPVVYKAGDSFVMKPGRVGVRKAIETVRKISPTVS